MVVFLPWVALDLLDSSLPILFLPDVKIFSACLLESSFCESHCLWRGRRGRGSMNVEDWPWKGGAYKCTCSPSISPQLTCWCFRNTSQNSGDCCWAWQQRWWQEDGNKPCRQVEVARSTSPQGTRTHPHEPPWLPGCVLRHFLHLQGRLEGGAGPPCARL